MPETPSPYAPSAPLPRPVVAPGEFTFAVAHLDHGHIFGQTAGLLEAGATLKWVFDTDPARRQAFLERFADSGARAAERIEDILDDPAVQLVTAATIPCERGPLGCRVMKAGKDYFTDKCPFTSLDQLAEAKRVAAASERKYLVYYSERLHVESAVHAGRLIADGVLGTLIHLSITGPHRHGSGRPAWFYEKAKYGGILTDICSHQVDQSLYNGGAADGVVAHARVDHFAHPAHPEFEDFGEAVFKVATGVSSHSRHDWLTLTGPRSWCSRPPFAVGTKGTLEIRKYIEVGQGRPGDRLYLVDGEREHVIDCAGKVGFPFFGELILDCLNRSEKAMTQHHAFKAAELSLRAQAMADAGRANA